jgi:DNA modification methylase
MHGAGSRVEQAVTQDGWQNTLYHGDNLTVLRDYISSGSVDLIYLDPPFNSRREYHLLLAEPNGHGPRAQVPAFADCWRWDEAAEAGYAEIAAQAPAPVAALVAAYRAALGRNDLTAYLVMMAPRLGELHRVLAAAGSIYLHCDPAASHYLKAIMDAVFGPAQFRREIVWRSGWVSGFKAAAKNWVRNHDVLLYYVKDARRFTFHKQYAPHPPSYRRRGGGGNPAGTAYDDVWTDIYSPWIMSYSREKRGYLTQKPLALLERIILASSNPGDLVLDPFGGGGTTLHAAQRLERRWIGIDNAPPAIALARSRLEAAFPGVLFHVQGASGQVSPS